MRLFRQIAFFAVAFIATLFFAEFFIRSTHLGNVSSTEFYTDIGRGRRKNLDYIFFNEGFGIGTFNEFRYIGEPINPRRENGTVRIILLGDSFVESFQVFDRHYFGNIAENYLSNEFPETRFEILNFGRSGFDIGDMYAYHKLFASEFNPDYVLYMLSEDDLNLQYSDPLRPRTIKRNDSLQVSLDFDESEIQRFEKTKIFTQYTCTLNMLNNCRKIVADTPVWSILLGKVYSWFNPPKDKGQVEIVTDSIFKLDPVTELIIESIDTNQVIFVTIDNHQLPKEFEEFCKSLGFDYFNLNETFDLMRNQGIDPNEWKVTNKTGHWNIEAHQYVGEKVGSWISEVIEKQGNIARDSI